jgi:hypothetical protein
MLKSEWARAQPIAFSWTPFDKKSYSIADGELFDFNNFDLNLGDFGNYHLVYS